MLEIEFSLGYFKGPEMNIICLIKEEPEEKYTLRKVIRFNSEGMTLSQLYHKNIWEVEAFYKEHYEKLDRYEVCSYIEEFEREFEEITEYRNHYKRWEIKGIDESDTIYRKDPNEFLKELLQMIDKRFGEHLKKFKRESKMIFSQMIYSQ